MRIVLLFVIYFSLIVGCGSDNFNSNKAPTGITNKKKISEVESEELAFKKIDFIRKSKFPFTESNAIEICSYVNKNYSESPSSISDSAFAIEDLKELVKLNSKQMDELEMILFGFTGGSITESACYEPRHAIVFYKSNKAITFLELCFECQQTRIYDIRNSKFKIDMSDEKWVMLKDFFKSIGITNFGPSSK